MSNEYKDWTADNMQELKHNEDLLRVAKTLAICAYTLANGKNPDNMYDVVGKTYISSLERDIEASDQTNLLNGADVNMDHLHMVFYLQDFISNIRMSNYDDSAIDEFLKLFPLDVVDALWKIQGESQGYNKLYYAYQIVSMVQTLKSKITYADIGNINDVFIGIGAIKEYHKHLFQEEQ